MAGTSPYQLMVERYHFKLSNIESMLGMNNQMENIPKKSRDIVMENITKQSGMLDISNHPVHIVNNQGNMSPSSFIPFCQIGGQYFGLQIEPFSVPICSGFEKKIFQGQICYSFNITKFQVPKVNRGRRNGLKLIIDLNSERESFLALSLIHI